MVEIGLFIDLYAIIAGSLPPAFRVRGIKPWGFLTTSPSYKNRKAPLYHAVVMVTQRTGKSTNKTRFRVVYTKVRATIFNKIGWVLINLLSCCQGQRRGIRY